MRVAIDARELAGRATGVGRYLAALVEQWAVSADARRHEWLLYAAAPIRVAECLAAGVRVLPGAGGTAWEQRTLPRALGHDRPDVLFAPAYSAPLLAPCPTALTIHDVSFAAHPEWFTWREGTRRRLLTAWSARRARIVLTDSAFSRREIVERLGVPPARVRAIALGAPAAPRSARAASLTNPDAIAHHDNIAHPDIAHRNIPHRHVHPRHVDHDRRHAPMVLYVGSLFRRRHVDRLIDAFASVVSSRVPGSRLEIVGENRMYPPLDFERLVATLPEAIRQRLSIRSYVDEETLGRLYEDASVFAFLSEYEGFGLTPLEALAAGVPPVVLDTAIAREVYGTAARYVTLDGCAEALVELLTSEDARRTLLSHAPAVLARYDWTRTASATLDAIAEAAGAA